eukprot:2588887-Pleurochrysis_carterae.AAC.1
MQDHDRCEFHSVNKFHARPQPIKRASDAHPSTYGAISADTAVSSGHAGALHSHCGETMVPGASGGLGGATKGDSSESCA